MNQKPQPATMSNLENLTDAELCAALELSPESLADLKASNPPQNADGTWSAPALLRFQYKQAFPEES